MLRRVFVLRIVAAADVTARQAKPQVDPRVAERDALCASVGLRFRVARGFQVFTNRFHQNPLAEWLVRTTEELRMAARTPLA
jgi:hypothetical protein